MPEPTEPFFIAQTDDPSHITTHDAILAWFTSKAREARAQGARFQRMSVSEDGKQLLYEAWKRQPRDQGPLRWQHTTKENDDGGQEQTIH